MLSVHLHLYRKVSKVNLNTKRILVRRTYKVYVSVCAKPNFLALDNLAASKNTYTCIHVSTKQLPVGQRLEEKNGRRNM